MKFPCLLGFWVRQMFPLMVHEYFWSIKGKEAGTKVQPTGAGILPFSHCMCLHNGNIHISKLPNVPIRSNS